jgi:hypothetical protein
MLTDLTIFLTVLAILPFMRTLKVLILQLQSNRLNVGDFTRAIESVGPNLSQRSTKPETSWSGSVFSGWLAVATPSKKRFKPSSGKQLRSRLCYQENEGRLVIHLQDEAGECTCMEAAACRVGNGDDEAPVPVSAARYQLLREGTEMAVKWHAL